ncbi:SpoIIE family protein phosphatase [Desulfofundulus sp. TPOSR]|uniref:SpoIIE family protein phosphatase n=1 Tax=Desulfofundulus sp. TPOSR TaxID=2714340 RepID=UPI00140DC36E|nr:SpoIIE family protein phosphatase [Desulfofundulus sp. TPOSR]NHM28461.1 SpoIIE family protein phosphatase [Desulfofundulus sp. TPOSR]
MGFCVDIGTAQLVKNGEEICGDTIEVVRTAGSHIVVVADGLGSGIKAKILSGLTAKTAGTMLKMGGRIVDVIETLALTLPICKVRNLAYSTFTIIQFTPDGQGYLVEYENPPSYIGMNNTLCSVDRKERVIGNKLIRECYFTVAENSWLVIVTDGVIHAGAGRTLSMTWDQHRLGVYLAATYSPARSATEWAQEIVQLCYRIYGEKPADDASVAVINIRKPRHVTVLIGPPRNVHDDVEVVDKLIRSNGMKVVCGGTTGNIVARILGRELKIDYSSGNGGVPPAGTIGGIDLVTEGAVTLVNAMEHLRKKTSLKELRGRDGASRLASILLAADSVHFIVGTAANPVLPETEIPAIFVYKQYIIRDLIRILQEMGKNVTVEFY